MGVDECKVYQLIRFDGMMLYCEGKIDVRKA